MSRRLPATGENLFQRIKRLRVQYEEQSGKPSLNLSVGEPDGVPTEITRRAAADATMREDREMHVYQDNDSPEGFDRAFVGHHVSVEIAESDEFDTLPIPGIKPMIGLLPLACGHNGGVDDVVMTGTTKPGYPIVKTWCAYLGCDYYDWPLYAENAFQPLLSDRPENVTLALFNYPNNPTGAVMDTEGWERICRWAVDNGVRLVNDAAYAGLVHGSHTTLSEVAPKFPELEWIELFSASKSHSATGWRVGVAFGHKDFIADLRMVKGNTDSGFVAPMAIGAMEAIQSDEAGLNGIREMYTRRIAILKELLSPYLRLAVEPQAGFFSFWHAPDRAFGMDVATADDFNNMMIDRCGMVGVPYTGSDGEYIRYAVCFPVEESVHQEAIRSAMSTAAPEYAVSEG
jgi:LL-diaminopimelate aminotransferase